MKYLFLLLLNIHILCTAFSKERPLPTHKWGLEADYQIGKIFKHTKNFQPIIGGVSQGVQITAFKQTDGSKAWQRKLKYPEIGGGFAAILHHNKDTIGNAYATFAYFSYPIVRSKIVDFMLRFSGGIAYTTKHYDEIKNPNNNVLSSPINVFVETRLGLNFKLHPSVQLLTGLAFSHYSNGAVRLPNLGINTPTFTIGLRYLNQSKPLEINKEPVEKPNLKNEMGFVCNLGFQDITRFTKDKDWLVYSTAVQYARYFNIVNKLYCGSLLEFDFGHPHLTENQDLAKDKLLPKAATRFSLYVGNEISFGRTSLFYAVGAYLYTAYKMPLPIYFKIGTAINFLALEKKNRPFINFAIKTHEGTAQYTEIGIGSNFKF